MDWDYTHVSNKLFMVIHGHCDVDPVKAINESVTRCGFEAYRLLSRAYDPYNSTPCTFWCSTFSKELLGRSRASSGQTRRFARPRLARLLHPGVMQVICTMLSGKLASQNYNTQVRGSTVAQLRALALAPPHVYIYLAIVKKILGDEATTIELGEASSHHKEQIELLGTFAQKMEAGNNSEAVTIILYFKLNTTYDNRWRVRFSCPDAQHRQSLSWCFLKFNEEEKKGRPPGANLPGIDSSGQQQRNHLD